MWLFLARENEIRGNGMTHFDCKHYGKRSTKITLFRLQDGIFGENGRMFQIRGPRVAGWVASRRLRRGGLGRKVFHQIMGGEIPFGSVKLHGGVKNFIAPHSGARIAGSKTLNSKLSVEGE